jgi:pyruvate/2-oxoglutarate dehydrogenase complex dihydrolipoamide dehydrogenase (E3) component
MQEHCLYQAFSPDIAQQADEVLEHAGIKVYINSKVKKIIGENGKATGVELDNGSIFNADLVICSIGYIPDTKLAKEAGININKNGAISVDNYLRTSEKDVFAVGDCAGTIGFITGRTDNVMLASTATAEARVLGYNLFNIKLLRNFGGVLSVFSTELNGKAFASTGAIEQTAKQANVSYVIGEFQAVDRHPAAIEDSSKLFVRLIVSPGDGSIIGGELVGGKSIGEMINIISLAIQKSVTVYEFVSFQVGTHPLLTTAPTQYVLIKAAENAIANIEASRN